MNLLSENTEKNLVYNLINLCEKHLLSVIEREYYKPEYVKQKQLLQELGINYAYLKKLEANGLKRVKLDPEDKTIFYKRKDVYALFDQLAE